MKERISSLLLFLTIASAFAQDRVIIYFKFGSSKIESSQAKSLNLIPSKYNLGDLDSVYFIGYADSVGKIAANLKLSERRARAVANYCEEIFPGNVVQRVLARGEKNKKIENRDRRVEVVMFFHKEEIPVVTKDSVKSKPVCWDIDYRTLALCHIRKVIKGRKEFIYLAIGKENLYERNVHFFVSNDTILNPVRWSSRVIGKLWWKMPVYQTQIPLNEFNKYKIVKTSDTPCTHCQLEAGTKDVIYIDSCLIQDYFLSRNMQVRRTFFRRKHLSFRCPIEYLDTSVQYYTYMNGYSLIQWTPGKRRNKNFYFGSVPIYFSEELGYYVNSGIWKLVPCCDSFKMNYMSCQMHSCCAAFNEFHFGVELGNNYLRGQNYPYIGLNFVDLYSRWQGALIAGMGRYLEPYASARIQYNYLTFPIGKHIYGGWQSQEEGNIRNYWRFYLGTELRTGKTSKQERILENNVHAGVSFVMTNRIVNRIFVQYSYGQNLLKPETNAYPLIQFGMATRFFSVPFPFGKRGKG